MWSIIWLPNAQRQLEALDEARRSQVVRKVVRASADPMRFFVPLRGSRWSKLRVGDYRVLAVVTHSPDKVTIHAVRHRSVAYRE